MHAAVEYATFAAFLAAAAKRPYNEVQGAAWAGTATFAEAHRLATEGWPEGLANMRSLRDAILRKVSKQVQKRRLQFAVAGGAVSVGRFVSGRPDPFMVRTPVAEQRAGKGKRLLKVVVNVGARQSVSPEVIFTRGAAVGGAGQRSRTE